MALLAGIASGQAGGVYSVKDLGPMTDVAGRTESGPNGLNAGGVVSAVNAVNGFYRGFLYNGTWTNLGTLGGIESLAAGLNDSGGVVGYSLTASGVTHGFLWSAGGIDGVPSNPQMKDIGGLGEGTTQAYGINNPGQITGYFDVVANSKLRQHAFVWANGMMTDIGALLGGLPNSFGYGINNLGHVTGAAYNASYSTPRGFFYNGTSAGEIGGLGGSDTTGLAINDADQITGYATTADGFEHAFLYSGSAMKDLGTLGGHYSYGLGINQDGAVVGGSYLDLKDSIYHAFIWSNNVMLDLNALLDDTGAGWVLAEARAINGAGQIVGSGTVGGANHIFLLTPVQANPPLQITAAALRGAEMVMRFTTVQNAVYSVEATAELGASNWSSVAAGIQGTGSIVEVTAPTPAGVFCQFFRVKRTL